MANQPWQEEENRDPIGILLDEFTDPEDAEAEFRDDFFQGSGGRRKKSAFMLSLIWAIALVLIFPSNLLKGLSAMPMRHLLRALRFGQIALVVLH